MAEVKHQLEINDRPRGAASIDTGTHQPASSASTVRTPAAPELDNMVDLNEFGLPPDEDIELNNNNMFDNRKGGNREHSSSHAMAEVENQLEINDRLRGATSTDMGTHRPASSASAVGTPAASELGKLIDFNEFGHPPVASEINTRIELNNDYGKWMGKSQEQSNCKSQEQSNFLISSFVVILFATSLPGVLTRSDANNMVESKKKNRQSDPGKGNQQRRRK